MAGGIGSRFWPWSTTEKPKQFLDIFGTGKTLIEQTFDRINRICPAENILIVTNELYRITIQNLLPMLPKENILCEPCRRNTAPCIAYGAYWIKKKNPEARILVAPSDHVILKEDYFIDVVNYGFEYASANDVLLTIGIEPHRPETGYGYIQANLKENSNEGFYKVQQFTEKPILEKAQQFLQSGDYFWNAGIFIWSVPSILNAFNKYLPDIIAEFEPYKNDFATEKETEAIQLIYDKCKSISIDYGIMEKADNVFVKTVDIGWSDVGTWGALHELSDRDGKENAVDQNKTILNEASNCIVKMSKNKIAVIDGLDDFIVIDDEKALLICRKSNEQKIRDFVDEVKNRFGKDYV